VCNGGYNFSDVFFNGPFDKEKQVGDQGQFRTIKILEGSKILKKQQLNLVFVIIFCGKFKTKESGIQKERRNE
jgi:hypothetical protein